MVMNMVLPKSDFNVQQTSLYVSSIGNCDIHAEQKISFINEMKWYEIWLRPKG